MAFRQLILVTHRWIGVAVSAFLCVIGLTGAVFFWPETSWVTRASGRLHETLALGPIGGWIVLLATACAVLLQVGGLYLWWQRKALKVRFQSGWRRALFDLHHLVGFTGFILMFILAATGVILFFVSPQDNPWLRKIAMDLHSARSYGWPIKVLYVTATIGFVVQSITGLVMWWRPSKGR